MSAPVTTSAPAAPSSSSAPRPRLLLLDGHSLAYRAFFALPVENFSTTTGQVTNAVYGFTSMLINVLRDEAPDHVAVAFDVSLIKEVLAALRVPTLEAEGFEADDIIATLATQADASGFEVLISSGDRDCLQLVTDN